MTRSVDDLAADVEAWVREKVNPLGTPETRMETAQAGRAALSELVALVGTLTQERDEALGKWQELEHPFDQSEFDAMHARAEAAEAALAREESQKRNLFFEREELWAALADMRRALEDFLESHPHNGAGLLPTPCVCALCEGARRALAAAGPAPDTLSEDRAAPDLVATPKVAEPREWANEPGGALPVGNDGGAGAARPSPAGPAPEEGTA